MIRSRLNTPALSRLLGGFLLLLVLSCSSLWASHNLAGEITYRYISGNQVELILTTYTDPSAAYVDRCEVDMEVLSASGTPLANGLITGIPRQNGTWSIDDLYPGNLNCPNAQMGEYIIGSIKKNVYKTVFTFPGPGYYSVRYYDVARLNDIINMANSGSQAFFVESSIFLNPYLGTQNSPQFLNHPIDEACTGKLWTHNPGGYDPDGDSLNYRFVNCRQYDPPSVPTPIICSLFEMPDAIGGNGPLTIDASTGLITWNTPNLIGIYNIAYVIEEYRDGILIGYTFRDMAIFVNPCDNDPPVIEAPAEICVYAGDTVEFDFTIYDPNFFSSVSPPGDSIYFYLNNSGSQANGPFAIANSPAEVVIVEPTGQQIPPDFPVDYNDTIKGKIIWNTECDHIRPAFYQIDFYAHDNLSYYNSNEMLSANLITKIRVLPRPLEGLTAVAANREITLNWTPHACDSAAGYQIYRRAGGGNWAEDTACCSSDPSSAGFSLIGTNQGHGNTTFVDDNNGRSFDFGVEYCYLVRAFFDNGIKSCATELVCVEIKKDFPVLLKDSVDVTDASIGEIEVAWSQPTEIDPIFPAPYTYTLLRADGINGAPTFAPIATGIAFGDTTYHDTGLNTADRGYRYRVDLYDANGDLIIDGNNGSSIYLTIAEGDKTLSLTWEEFVPWSNRQYDVYRADQIGGPYVFIATVNGNFGTRHSYVDRNLTNFEDYCYVIVSEGEYLTDGVPDSVRNASQIACGIPQDFEPPCIGTVVIDTSKDCVAHAVNFSWNYPDSLCGGDLDFFTIYRADNRDADFVQIAVVDSGTTAFTVPNVGTISDCYGLTATDTNGNESSMRIYCFENCPVLEVGNVFSPNGDGVNDFFSPLQDRNIKVTLVQIFDRWGNKIYDNNSVGDSRKLWDGNNMNGVAVPEGVYYYLIQYQEERLPGYIPMRPISGNVTILR